MQSVWLNESGFMEKRIISWSLETWEENKGGKVTAAQEPDPGLSCRWCTGKSRITVKLKD